MPASADQRRAAGGGVPGTGETGAVRTCAPAAGEGRSKGEGEDRENGLLRCEPQWLQAACWDMAIPPGAYREERRPTWPALRQGAMRRVRGSPPVLCGAVRRSSSTPRPNAPAAIQLQVSPPMPMRKWSARPKEAAGDDRVCASRAGRRAARRRRLGSGKTTVRRRAEDLQVIARIQESSRTGRLVASWSCARSAIRSRRSRQRRLSRSAAWAGMTRRGRSAAEALRQLWLGQDQPQRRPFRP
jgi:hypothetical protein